MNDKRRIEHLLYEDAERLPFLSLVPPGAESADVVIPPATFLRPALVARLEKVRSERETLAEKDSDDHESKETESGVENEVAAPTERSDDSRAELSMLMAALDWIALQEDRS